MDKRALRSQLRELRQVGQAAQTPSQWAERADRLAEAMLGDSTVRRAIADRSTVASYASYGCEPSTQHVNRALADAGVRVVLPVVERHGVAFDELAWADLEPEPSFDARGVPSPSGRLVGRGSAGLMELRCAIVIIPALAVGRDGSRLGQGAGFYDRMLAGLPRLGERDEHDRPGPLRLAIVGSGEVFESLPLEPHDQLVDRFLVF